MSEERLGCWEDVKMGIGMGWGDRKIGKMGRWEEAWGDGKRGVIGRCKDGNRPGVGRGG